jgi:dynein heavy chain
LTKNESIADILKTDDLIIVLDESKTVSDDIKIRMAESAVTEKMIDETREAYRPVAFRASILFFTIIDLAAINDMYQYSLQWFSALFGASVNNSVKTKEGQVAQRIENLNNHFTLSLYENICRSLFEKNKLMFSLVLCVKILFGDKNLDPDEWRFFLAGPTGQIEVVPNPTTWLGELEWGTMWKQIFVMS